MPKWVSEAQPDASKFAEWFRATTGSASKTALVMLAVLLFTIINGIEPTYERVEKKRQRSRSDNRIVQSIDRNSVADALFIADVAQRTAVANASKNTDADDQKKLLAFAKKPPKTASDIAEYHRLRDRQAQKTRLFTDQQRARKLQEKAKRDDEARQSLIRSHVEEKKASERKREDDVSFELLGQKLSLAPAMACVAWSAILIILLRYMTTRRQVVIRATNDELARTPSAVLHDAIRRDVDWWLAPVPSALAPDVGRDTILDVYDWHTAHLAIGSAIVVTTALLTGANGFVLWRALSLALHIGGKSERAFIIPAATALLFLVTASAANFLSGRSRVDDRGIAAAAGALVVLAAALFSIFSATQLVSDAIAKLVLRMPALIAITILIVAVSGFEVLIRSDEGSARRRFARRFAYAVAGAALLAIAWPWRSKSKASWRRRKTKPRRVAGRAKRFAVSLPDGFYINLKSGVIYGVERGATYGDTRKTQLQAMPLPLRESQLFFVGTPLLSFGILKELTDTPNNRVLLQRSSIIFERRALRLIESGDPRKIEDACKLLVYAINHDLYLKQGGRRLSLRLWDLLAGVSLRYTRPRYADEIDRLIDQFHLEPFFRARLQRWRDPASTWYQRWIRRDTKVRWNGVMLS